MKYFVTGATGFIGGEVVRQLCAAGHEVIALVRSPDKARGLSDLGVHLHPGDITDKDSMRAGMSGVDGVFHLAAWYKIGARDKARAYQINVDGTRHVLELMRELHIPKGVYTSTVGVFSDTHGQVVDENYRYDGPFLNEYERTKWLAHYEVALPMIRDGLPLVIVQPGMVYGPGDTSMLHTQLSQYLQGKLYFVPKGAAFCWGHVEDTARGHILAMEKGVPGESYIIAGQVCSFEDVLQIGERITGIPSPRLHIPGGVIRVLAGVVGLVEKVIPVPEMYTAETLRTAASATYLASNEKAQRELGFTVRPLEEGLRELARYEMQQLGKQPQF